MSWSIWQVLVILVIVLLLFGTKKLRNIGSDLGSAIKGFKKSMNADADEADTTTAARTDSDESKAKRKDGRKDGTQ